MKKKQYLVVALFFLSVISFSQSNTGKIKAQFALGVNSPSSDGFVSGFEAKPINFPTFNLGLQYMFIPVLGAKIDYGFNRFSNSSESLEFKVNYNRFDLQLVGDISRIMPVNRIGAFVHAGGGYSMIKPLGEYAYNDTSYLNAMGGIEFHFGISDSASLYLDASYIKGFAKDFNPVSTGMGSFNGDLITVTLGMSISLTGCEYCN